jgi:hypothetical protein
MGVTMGNLGICGREPRRNCETLERGGMIIERAI